MRKAFLAVLLLFVLPTLTVVAERTIWISLPKGMEDPFIKQDLLNTVITANPTESRLVMNYSVLFLDPSDKTLRYELPMRFFIASKEDDEWATVMHECILFILDPEDNMRVEEMVSIFKTNDGMPVGTMELLAMTVMILEKTNNQDYTFIRSNPQGEISYTIPLGEMDEGLYVFVFMPGNLIVQVQILGPCGTEVAIDGIKQDQNLVEFLEE